MVPDNASTAAGSVGTARLTAATVSKTPLSVTVQFGPNGLEGRFPSAGEAPAAAPADAVIVQASMPGLPVAAAADGSFTAAADTVLATGEYVAGGVGGEAGARYGVGAREGRH